MRKNINIDGIIRNPYYLADFEELEKIQDKSSLEHILLERKILGKWNLTSIINPKDYKKSSEKYTGDFTARQQFYYVDRNTDRYWRDRRYILIEVDLTKPVTKICSKVKDVVKENQGFLPRKRDKGENIINRFDVWDEYLVLKSFSKVARRNGVNKSTVRKAYYRAFEEIMGEKYDPTQYNQKKLTKQQLKKSCDTCKENPDKGGKCDTLCPEVLSYVIQDEGKLREKII